MLSEHLGYPVGGKKKPRWGISITDKISTAEQLNIGGCLPDCLRDDDTKGNQVPGDTWLSIAVIERLNSDANRCNKS